MSENKPARGRPPSITRTRIADAGIELGLPNVTFVGVASQLGVSHMALYKHVSGLEALKQLIAEEMFLRWPLPDLTDTTCIKTYLLALSKSMWALVAQYPGIAPYMLHADMITPAMLDKIQNHQAEFANACGLSLETSHRLLFTIAYHCVAVADTVRPGQETLKREVSAHESAEDFEIDSEYFFGVKALIAGAISTLDEN